MFLKPNVVGEPLINHWYGWSYLIHRATASLLTVHQLRIMKSFVQNPKLHLAASRNPQLLGDTFLNYEGDPARIGEIARRTETGCADMLELAAALQALREMLDSHADGHSLECLYEKVPVPLRGLVELFYESGNNAAFRFIEPLLFGSRLYRPDIQAILLSILPDPDDRAFVLSTPRTQESGSLLLRLPFADPLVDALFRTRSQPAPDGLVDALVSRCKLGEEERALLESFFTEAEPARLPAAPAGEEAVRVRYFGHATVLIEAAGVAVLTDPAIAYDHPDGAERYSYSDLPEKIDYVLLTHNHQDHVLLESLLQLRHKIGQIVVPKNSGGTLLDPSLRWILRAAGFDNVVELDEMEDIQLPSGRIVGLPFFGEHGDLQIRSKLGYMVELLGKKITLLADSNNIEPMMYQHVHDMVGDVDTLFLGMECRGAPTSWIYGPLLAKPLSRSMDQSRRLNGSNCASAISILDQFKPRQTFIYAMGAEPWLKYISSIEPSEESEPVVESNKLLQHCEDRGIPCRRLWLRDEAYL